MLLQTKQSLLANQFAADYSDPPERISWSSLESLGSGRVSRDEVLQFARSIGTEAGVVVGRLQHDGLLP